MTHAVCLLQTFARLPIVMTWHTMTTTFASASARSAIREKVAADEDWPIMAAVSSLVDGTGKSNVVALIGAEALRLEGGPPRTARAASNPIL